MARKTSIDQVIRIVSEASKDAAKHAIYCINDYGSLEVVIRQSKKARTNAHNSALWAAIMRDIAGQAVVDGRTYSADIWHEHFKREFLPTESDEDYEKMVVPGYQKWEMLPNGEMILKGSTTKLTPYGMSVYMTRVEAYAATELGVRFSARWGD